MPPPPPPPPAPLPGGGARTARPAVSARGGGRPAAAASDRSALMGDICKGARLKKTVTNDRSSPNIGGSASGPGSARPDAGGRAAAASNKLSAANPHDMGPPQLGGLFAGGMPKLKPAGAARNKPAPGSGRVMLPPGHNPTNNTTNGGCNGPASRFTVAGKAPPPTPTRNGGAATSSQTLSAHQLPYPPLSSLKPARNNSLTQCQTMGRKSGGEKQSRPSVLSPKPSTLAVRPPSSRPALPPMMLVNNERNPPPPPPPRSPSTEFSSSSSAPLSVRRNSPAAPGSAPARRIPPPPPHANKPSAVTGVSRAQLNKPPPPPPMRSTSSSSSSSMAAAAPTSSPRAPPRESSASQLSLATAPTPPIRSLTELSKQVPRRVSNASTSSLPQPPRQQQVNGLNNEPEDFSVRCLCMFRDIRHLPPPDPFSNCQKVYPSKNPKNKSARRPAVPPPPPSAAQLGY